MKPTKSTLDIQDLHLLKALIELDLRDPKEIAAAAGISRPYLMNCLSGERYLSGDPLLKLLSTLNVRNWVLDKKIVHLYQVTADLANLVLIVNRYFKRPVITPLSFTDEVEESKPYVGYFLISESDIVLHSLPQPPYLLIHRNHYYIGRGRKEFMKPEDALALLPESFNNANWSSKRRKNRVEDVEVIRRKLETIFKERANVYVEDINTIVNATAEITWQDVIDNAIGYELTPAQVYKLIDDSIPPQEENPDPGYGF